MAIPGTIKKIGCFFKNRILKRTLLPYVIVRIEKSDLRRIVDYCEYKNMTIQEAMTKEVVKSLMVKIKRHEDLEIPF